MGKTKELGLDHSGIQKMMHRKDYLADMSGQFALGLMGNLVGQLTYFYTDKVGLAMAAVGVAMTIAKILDAFTDIIFGHMIDRMKGGNRKYFKWLLSMGIPAAVLTVLLFTVPHTSSQLPSLVYVCLTNILFTAVIMTIISTPYAAVLVIRTDSQEERSTMGIYRAVGNYGAGMVIAIATIPVTNALGGNQNAWIKYGIILALVILLCFLLAYKNLNHAKFANEGTEEDEKENEKDTQTGFAKAASMLFHNKYWVIVLLFNLITQVTNTLAGSAGTYYCKWIFGNDNLVAVVGAMGLFATLIGFATSNLIIRKLGVKKTVLLGLIGASLMAGIRCILPENFYLYIATSLLGSYIQIPMMCLYGVLLAMAIDYNEWKYNEKLMAMSSGAIGFGNKVGGGIGTLLLTGILALGGYTTKVTLETMPNAMRGSLYAINNYVPMIINLIMFVIFLKFDLEKKLPGIQADLKKRREESGKTVQE